MAPYRRQCTIMTALVLAVHFAQPHPTTSKDSATRYQEEPPCSHIGSRYWHGDERSAMDKHFIAWSNAKSRGRLGGGLRWQELRRSKKSSAPCSWRMPVQIPGTLSPIEPSRSRLQRLELLLSRPKLALIPIACVSLQSHLTKCELGQSNHPRQAALLQASMWA